MREQQQQDHHFCKQLDERLYVRNSSMSLYVYAKLV
jgi:hypothetical protein